MSEKSEKAIREICKACGNDRTRMMDIVRAVQERFGCVSPAAREVIAKATSTHPVEVEGVVSFYAFLSQRPAGEVSIRLCNDVIDEMVGGKEVAQTLRQELGIDFGQTTPDGRISLGYAACIGMSDQAPAALVNDVVVTELCPDAARQMVRDLREHMDPSRLVRKLGDGNNAHELVGAMVKNNLRQAGPVIFEEMVPGEALKKALAMTPTEVIRDMKTARLRGRGGAGFPTGMKWEFTRAAEGQERYILCNADEGEPGTFKDRVILTERADLMLEGMVIAGYAVGARSGIIYLRAEYAYLRRLLESILADWRNAKMLGRNVCGKDGFDFDVRMQMGAGAYICGEETSLISSCEGLRGDPKTRPPFPAQRGYLGEPTVVNNVETFCCAARILEKGPGWFAQIGAKGSPGTKLLSISGDCKRPGVYEVPFGIRLAEFLKLAGAEDAIAVQVGGPSGQMVGPADYGREISYDDLATGGSIMAFGPGRDVLAVAAKFMEFFVEESCGYCTPCRVGNVLLKERLEDIRAGRGEPADLKYLQELGESVKFSSRCGLGQTSPNPVLTTLKNFRSLCEAKVAEPVAGVQPTFDIRAAVKDAEAIAGHGSMQFQA